MRPTCFHKFQFHKVAAAGVLVILLSFSTPLSVLSAQEITIENSEEARRALPVQTDEIPGWPSAPETSAQAAILMEAETGTILYAKNIHEKLYPASTTKLMTCLVAEENSSLDETVDFTYEIVSSIPSDGSAMGIDAGESLPMEECLYGIMVASANEVASGVAAHVAGSTESFVDMMNQKAADLGCQNTHFVNANGLHDEEHYTSAYDLALIGRAFFNNDVLRRIGNTSKYHFEATPTQPDDFYKTNKHKLITGEYPYEGIIGGKTGYTDHAHQTLVTGCEQNGLRLICVVLLEDAPAQFEDTITLFDYGYQNFSKVDIADHETRYTVQGQGFSGFNFGESANTGNLLTLRKGDSLILPNMSSFSDLDASVTYGADGLDNKEVARIDYSYHGVPIGSGVLCYSGFSSDGYAFESTSADAIIAGRPDNVIFINIKLFLTIVGALIVLLILIQIIYSLFFGRGSSRVDRARRRKLRKQDRQRRKIRRSSERMEKQRRQIVRRRR